MTKPTLSQAQTQSERVYRALKAVEAQYGVNHATQTLHAELHKAAGMVAELYDVHPTSLHTEAGVKPT